MTDYFFYRIEYRNGYVTSGNFPTWEDAKRYADSLFDGGMPYILTETQKDYDWGGWYDYL